MQRGNDDDVFEDFASDSDGGDNVDDGYVSDDFDDEHIANVLELMDERVRPSTALSTISEEETSTELSTNSSGEYVVSRGGGEDPGALPAATSIVKSTSRAPADVPSTLSLLDELFPPLDPLTPLATESAIDTLKLQSTTSSESPSPLVLADRSFEPARRRASDESLRLARQRTENPSQSSAIHIATDSPARDDQEQQPEWMRELLDEMYKQSTSPRVTKSAKAPATVAVTEVDDADEIAGGPNKVSHQLLSSTSAAATPANNSREEILFPPRSELPPEDPTALEIDSTLASPPHQSASGEPSISSSLDGNVSCSSLVWGKFSPDMMPARQSSKPLSFLKTGGVGSGKQLCYVPMLRSQKRRPRPRVVTPAETELTFRPTINTRYLACVTSLCCCSVLGETTNRQPTPLLSPLSRCSALS